MKKRTFIGLALLVLTAVAATLYFGRSERAETVNLQTVKPQYGFIGKSVTATGTIQPVDTVIVGAQVSGVVKAVYADYNNPVRQGQLLAKVDPSIIIAQIEQARAVLANAQSNLQFQESNFNRQQQLYDLGAISKADYQVALNQYQVARAVVGNASAQVKLTQRNLSYTNIYSPINGVVLNKNISAGQTIASSFNAPTLFVIARDLSKIRVNAAVDEADIGEVKPGQPVSFTVDAFPDNTFNGKVQKIYLHPSVSANVVTYSTLITIDNREMKLRPGMTASINIYTAIDSNALLVPAKALNVQPDSVQLKKYVLKKTGKGSGSGKSRIRQENNGLTKDIADVVPGSPSFVWIKRGDTLVERKIRTGINDGTSVQVLKGLSPNEDVTTGISGGKNGSAGGAQRSPFMPQMRRPSGGGQRAQ